MKKVENHCSKASMLLTVDKLPLKNLIPLSTSTCHAFLTTIQSTTVLTTREGVRIAKLERCREKVCSPILSCGIQPNTHLKTFGARSAHLQNESSSPCDSGEHPRLGSR